MAVTGIVWRYDEKSYNETPEGEREYVEEYMVKHTSYSEEASTILGAMPFVGRGNAHPFDPYARVVERSVERTDSPCHSKVLITYRTNFTDKSERDPLDEPARMSMRSRVTKVPLKEAYLLEEDWRTQLESAAVITDTLLTQIREKDDLPGGAPLEAPVNSAGDLFNPAPSRDGVQYILQVRYNVDAFDPAWLEVLKNPVNKDRFTFGDTDTTTGITVQPYHARVYDFTFSEMKTKVLSDGSGTDFTREYYTISYSVILDLENSHALGIIDNGFYTNVSGTREHIKIDDRNVKVPQLLDGTGDAKDVSDRTPYILWWEPENKIQFGSELPGFKEALENFFLGEDTTVGSPSEVEIAAWEAIVEGAAGGFGIPAEE